MQIYHSHTSPAVQIHTNANVPEHDADLQVHTIAVKPRMTLTAVMNTNEHAPRSRVPENFRL